MALGFINDGYTETAVIVEVRGLYPRVQFRFRPMLIEERVEYFRAAEKMTGLQLRRYVARWLAKKMQDWDLKDQKGNVVPIAEDAMLKVKSRLFDRLFQIISTEEPPDESPDRTAEEQDGEIKDLLESLDKGRPVTEVREERERKN